KWAQENLVTSLKQYSADFVSVYDTDFKLVYSVDNLDSSQIIKDLFSRKVISGQFLKSPFCHFFASVPLGLLEISGATIHPTADFDRKTPTQGFFFVGRLWDKHFISEISRLADSQISIYSFKADSPKPSPSKAALGQLAFSQKLYGWDGNPVAFLEAKVASPLGAAFNYFLKTRVIFYAFYSFALFILLSVFLSLWVARPLAVLSVALKTGKIKELRKLRRSPNEFGELALLIEKYFAQNEKLITEVERRKRTLRRLLASEEKFLRIFRSSPIAIGIIDSESWRFSDVNNTFLSNFGFLREESIGRTCVELGIFSEKQFEELRQLMLTTGLLHNVELLFKTKSGEERIGEISTEMVKIEGKRMVVATMDDITERKRLEKELSKRIEQLEKFHRIAVGRELRMKELKERISELEKNTQI
ncbi:MAG: PAS domain S-box protein, partial [Candidatus Omnitrophica bacterium]|nr:PAS domain S-box protein [Candidatus Omnitrophota bacterium]